MWWLLFVECLYGTGWFGTVTAGMVALAVFLTVATLLTLVLDILSEPARLLNPLTALVWGL